MIRILLVGFSLTCLLLGCKAEAVAPLSDTEVSVDIEEVLTDNQDTLKLDHVPIAVRALEDAVKTYRDLGFSIKPCRLHLNSINNAHIKFGDGTALELITAKEQADQLAAHYLALLREGEGAAFLSLDGGDVNRITQKSGVRQFNPVSTSASYANTVTFDFSIRVGYWFFLEYTRPPIDKIEHLAHANGAVGLEAVWLVGTDLEDEQAILAAFGKRVFSSVEIPVMGLKGDVYKLDRGSLYLFPTDEKSPGISPVLGASVRVENIESTRDLLSNRLGIALQIYSDYRGKSILIEPEKTHGIWMEFIEPEN